jgi:hypothetical protein
MPTIAVGALPRPTSAAFVPDTVQRVSSVGGLPRFRQPDPKVNPRRWQVAWQQVTGATADAIRRHYDEWPHAVWQMTLRGAVVRVQWSQPPNIQWSSQAFADVTGELEEVLAYQ